MIKTYLTLAFRNLVHRAQFSILNIVGLSIGMAACFTLVQFARFEQSYDSFNLQGDQIYRLGLSLTTDQLAKTAVPKNFSALGPALKDKFSEIKDYVRIFPVDGTIAIKRGALAFNEKNILFTDASIFNVFTFPMIHGDPTTALQEPYSVVLTETTARKYFNEEDPIGKSLTMREGKLNIDLIVKGVVKDVPENSHLTFDFLISHATLSATWGERADRSWNEALFYTYILLEPETHSNDILSKLTPKLLQEYTHWNSSLKVEFVIQPLREIYLTSHMVQEARVNGSSRQTSMLWIIAGLIVMLSWINYINISTARYLERAKEVGVRKIIGATRWHLLMQFITESTLMTLISIALSLFFVQSLIPFFNTFTGKSIPMWDEPLVLLSILGFFLGGSILSSLVPSQILSSLNTVSVLKGKIRSSTSGIVLRKSLTVLQFMSAAVIIGGTFIVYVQLNYMTDSDLGADISQTIILPTPDITDSTSYRGVASFKARLLSHADIDWVVSSTSIPGKQDNIIAGGLCKFENADKEGMNHYHFGVDRSFIEAYKMKLKAGRNFSTTGDSESVILNETAVRLLGFVNAEEAIGRRIAANWSAEKKIIGVVEDFHQHSLRSAIDPVAFSLDESGDDGYYSIKLSKHSASFRESLAVIDTEWQSAFPGNPFDYFFLDNYFNEQYQDDIRFGRVLSVFSVLGLIIACLGIFGLSVFNAAQRTKEIGVRKVLGATVTNILILLSKEYVLLILLSLGIAVPLTYYTTNQWLNNYAYRIEISWWMLTIPAVLIVMVALVTICAQSVKAAMANPARSLNT